MSNIIPNKPVIVVIPKNTKVLKKKFVQIKENNSIEGYMVYKILVIMDGLGYLPKGYLTRIKNGHIKLSTARKKAQLIANEVNFPYRISAKSVGGNRYAVVLYKLITTKSA